MKAAFKLGAWIVCLSLCFALAKASPEPRVLKVKIEATELDRKMLLSRLNANGGDQFTKTSDRMKFELAESDYDYRIVFSTGQGTSLTLMRGSGGSSNSSNASADVFDGKGTELFRFERNQRRTDEGAVNAIAEEIIKRIRKLKKLNSR